MVFAGTPEAALPSLKALIDSRHDVVAVVTRPDARVGRGRQMETSPVGRLAAEHGIEVLKPAKPSDPEFIDRLVALSPDCCPVVAYGAILGEAELAVPPHGWVNLHFSVLPAWRGAAPVQRAIMAGDEVTGATVFRIVKELDAGPLFGLLTERIRDEDTAGDLLDRLAHHGAHLLVDVLNHIEDGDIEAYAQEEGDAESYAPKLSVDDARIDWTRPAYALDRVIRGCTPAPGAWTTLAGERIKLEPATPHQLEQDLAPGEIRASKDAVLVGTGTVALLLGRVQPHGKKPMKAADWARGVRLHEGMRFE